MNSEISKLASDPTLNQILPQQAQDDTYAYGRLQKTRRQFLQCVQKGCEGLVVHTPSDAQLDRKIYASSDGYRLCPHIHILRFYASEFSWHQ